MILAGLFAGLTEAFVVNPFEVVKVRLQTDQSQFSKVWTILFQRDYKSSNKTKFDKKQKSSLETAKLIYKENGFGLNGLNRGLTATLGRHGIWNGVYFGFYHNIKVYIPKSDVNSWEYCYIILRAIISNEMFL